MSGTAAGKGLSAEIHMTSKLSHHPKCSTLIFIYDPLILLTSPSSTSSRRTTACGRQFRCIPIVISRLLGVTALPHQFQATEPEFKSFRQNSHRTLWSVLSHLRLIGHSTTARKQPKPAISGVTDPQLTQAGGRRLHRFCTTGCLNWCDSGQSAFVSE
jgi:hypothetical protein